MEVIQGFDLYRTSGRTDLKVPDQADTLQFFRLQSPADLGMPVPETLNYPDAPPTHTKTGIVRKRTRPAGVTNVGWFDLQFDELPGHALVYCDIGSGAVNAFWPDHPDVPIKRLATLLQPVHVEPCDLDQDGRRDLIVADIGEFNADDSDLGRIIYLRRDADQDSFQTHVLIDGLSRPSDARPGDFDGDGDTDVLVAAFGWRNSGKTLLLVNQGNDDQGIPVFETRDLDQRHGPVNVPPVDFDGDGDLDFISLISQEHECVDLFRNDGSGHFVREPIWAAPDPAYGSSGIELVDMDRDGDLDVLYTNGDSFDRGPKPYHSIQWLENDGSLPMKRHPISLMPGVLNATAADFDGDGDMDVVAVALLPWQTSQQWVAQGASPIVMLTQDDQGNFTPSRLAGRLHDHLSVVQGDFNHDSRPDFAIGNFFRVPAAQTPAVIEQPELLIWQSVAE
ncbi:FG-GAP repeat domain-containing protein [Stieleria tagensis]|uniref:FG-GAP repeat domain-containing protein n=1 Tax=Stieleria tagensis TaxID=2956795 RepID=UPI00209B4E94|nr:VCBS repeat-containing protein [Stieleria tagensis]